jgi:hypothetical protein
MGETVGFRARIEIATQPQSSWQSIPRERTTPGWEKTFDETYRSTYVPFADWKQHKPSVNRLNSDVPVSPNSFSSRQAFSQNLKTKRETDSLTLTVEISRWHSLATAERFWVHSQHVHPKHPPDKEYRDDRPRDVNYPVAGCFGFPKIEHAQW